MKKKTVIIALYIAIGLVVGCAFSSQKADAAEYVYECYVPYNIKIGNWDTGLHIRSRNSNEVIDVLFFKNMSNYATVTLDMGAPNSAQWTGTPEELLSLPVILSQNPGVTAPVPIFQSGSTLIFKSTIGKFTVTQFLMNGIGGFGFQTFYSYPYGSWPNTIVLLEPQGAEGMSSSSDAIPPME